VLSAVALTLLFIRPEDYTLWFPFLMLSVPLTTFRLSGRTETTRDASALALVIAFGAVAILFALFLVPGSFWLGIDGLAPEGPRSMVRAAPPLWVRIGLSVLWGVMTWRRFCQQRDMAEHAAPAGT